jgi:hypothetical protein
MTRERERKREELARTVSLTLHGSQLSNQEVIDVLSLSLCSEAQCAFEECGMAGVEAVMNRFLRQCTSRLPGVSFHVLRHAET